MSTAPATTRKPTSRLVRSAYHPLMIVAAAVCLGIVADRAAGPSIGCWWLLAAVALLAWWGTWAFRRERLACVCLLLAFAALGGGWHHQQWFLFPDDDLANFAQEDARPVAVEAVACETPRVLPAPPREPLRAIPIGDRSRLEVEVVRIRAGARWLPAAGKSRLTVDGHLLGVHAGDRLLVYANLAAIAPPRNPGERDFAAHARADRRRCTLHVGYPDCVQVVQAAATWRLQGAIDRLRQAGDAKLRRYVAPSQSGFAAALILGSREQLDDERSDAFLRTNTIHFLAISGLHVAIMAGCLFAALRWGLMPKRWALAAVSAATILYTMITDSPPSAVRAAVLVLLVCMAMWCGRPCSPWNCLAAGALVVLALNPADLFRIGPQLSFLAVAVLCLLGPYWSRLRNQDALERLIERTRPWPKRFLLWLARWWWRATIVTAVVWLVTLPLIVENFHLVAPVAVLLSPILSPLVAVALMSGLALLLVGWIAPPLAAGLGSLCAASLRRIDALVAWGDALPLAHFWVPSPAVWWLAVFYLGFTLWSSLPQRRPRWQIAFAAVGMWAALAVLGWGFARRSNNQLECAFLSVGHGCCVVLHLPDGGTMLYDAGKLGSPSGSAQIIAQYLWSRGVTRLDAVMISHADVDHFNALPQLAEQIEIDAVYAAPGMARDLTSGDDASLAVLWAALDRHGIPLRTLAQGDELHRGDCRLRVLHPQTVATPGGDNANSLVLLLECRGRRLLLPGDLEREGARELLGQPAADCDVLLAPHHGSGHSNPPGFAQHFSPEWVVISGGMTQTAPEVADAFTSAGARVLHTARHSAVRVRIDEFGRLDVQPFRTPP